MHKKAEQPAVGSRIRQFLDSQQGQYARTGAMVGGGLSALRSLLQNRPIRDTLTNALSGAGLGAGTGLATHAVGTGAGYNMPGFRQGKTAAAGLGKLLVPGREIARRGLRLGGIGAGAGGIVGAVRSKDEGESRLRAILRSAFTGGALGGGAGVGAGVGMRAGINPLVKGMTNLNAAPILVGTAAPYAGTALGGVGGYQLARRRPQEKTAGIGTTIGALVGLLRRKDPGETTRGQAVARSAGTGVMTDVGGVYGGLLGLAAGKALARGPGIVGALGGLGGIGAGSVLGYRAGRRHPQDKTAGVKRAAPATLLGGIIGARRERDIGEPRGRAILRSARTGFGTDLWGTIGGGIGRLVTGRKRPALIGAGLGAGLGFLRNRRPLDPGLDKLNRQREMHRELTEAVSRNQPKTAGVARRLIMRNILTQAFNG